MAEVWAALTTAVVAAGGAAYAANQQSKAAKAASAQIGGAQNVALPRAPAAVMVDWRKVLSDTVDSNSANLDKNFQQANRINLFNENQALRGYSKMQPYYKELQAQIGRNALSYSRGELPTDVVNSISRGAATQGFANGIAGGSRGGGFNSALGGLNLRNLGLTSLQLSQQGTDTAMRANSAAAAMTPGLFNPAQNMITPGQAIAADQFNASAINQVNQLNAGIGGNEAGANTALRNNILEQQAQIEYQRQLANAQAVQSGSQSAAGVAGALLSQNNNGFSNSALGARIGSGSLSGSVTNSPYGYAIRPDTVV